MTNIISRPRRNRCKTWIRDLLAEVKIDASDLILPIFIVDGKSQKQEIPTLSGVHRFSIDLAIEQAQKAWSLGIKAIMLFPQTPQNLKSDDGKEALNPQNLICKATREIKKHVPEIGVICDVALDPYTTHGHDGVLKNGDVENDLTVEILCKQALNQARAGCDVIAPSDMMDGRVLEIRKILDENDFKNVAIMSYAVKYASHFYGPFRDAVGSRENIKSADKKTYQMDFRNKKEAIIEVTSDQQQGADMMIVKPAISYLDIVKTVSQETQIPIITYQVSGEYAILKLGAQNGFFDFNEALHENLIACKRAGASAIITYGAFEVIEYLKSV